MHDDNIFMLKLSTSNILQSFSSPENSDSNKAINDYLYIYNITSYCYHIPFLVLLTTDSALFDISKKKCLCDKPIFVFDSINIVEGVFLSLILI